MAGPFAESFAELGRRRRIEWQDAVDDAARPIVQPAPTPNDSVPVADQLQGYLSRRKALGVQRYGIALQAGNGRDALVDALEEAVDLAQYLAQAVIERDGRLP